MNDVPKILIVEDNVIVAADIKERVTRMGYLVTDCVTRGEAALESVHRNPPNLILMDIKLKGEMNGIEAYSHIRADHDIPLIYLTSYTDEDTLARAKITEPFGYIVKPFQDKELRSTIEIATYKHKIEHQLKESEQWMRTTLKSIGDGVITTGMDGKVTFMNPVAESLTGWSRQDAKGRPLSEVFNIINEITLEPSENPVAKVIETGQIIGLANHTLLISRDGRRMPIKDSGAPILLNGIEKLGVVLVFQDDTEARVAENQLRASEERFKILFDNAPLPYQSLDENGNFLEVNNTWLEVLGYQKKDVIGKSFGDFLNPEWVNHFKEYFPKFKALGEVLGVEFEIKRGDGSYMLVKFDGKTSKDGVGNFLQTHCVFRDITEEAKLKQKIASQEVALRQGQKLEAMGTLAGGIAHDFNNILSAIIGFTELAKCHNPDNSKLIADLDQIYTAGIRAKDLVQQILTFSRKSSYSLRLTEVSSIVKEALKLLRSMLPATIEFEEKIAENLSPVLADPTQLHQIIMNLCTNSGHAMEGQEGTLTIKITETLPSDQFFSNHPTLIRGSYVEICIQDTGTGIDPEIEHLIFDPYFTTKNHGDGTGLGLSVTHGIVSEMGGTIEVESESGIGSSFTVFLPVSEKTVQVNSFSNAMTLPEGGSERILLVDDEVSILKLLSRFLKNSGYSVTTESDGQAALELFSKNPFDFDLVISDVSMPKLSGEHLARRMLEIRPDLPILLASGHYSTTISDATVSELGVKGLLQKPTSRVFLLHKVRQVLDEFGKAA